MAVQHAVDELIVADLEAFNYFREVHKHDSIWVYHYFGYVCQGTFLDPTCNNLFVTRQAEVNQKMAPILRSRELFETELKARSGLEYFIVGEPKPGQGGDGSVWVMRKQRREKGGVVGEVLGTYYLIGENWYQAPSVADVVKSRLLTITTQLQSMLTSAPTPFFSPSTGFVYAPHRLAKSKPADSQATRASANTTRQNSPEPSFSAAPSILGDAAKAPKDSTSESLTSLSLLTESLDLSLRFGSEYTDENPLLGEPGSFKFSASNQAVRDRQAAETARAEKAAAEKAAAVEKAETSKSTSVATTPLVGARPLLVDVDRPKKRKKSTGPLSPISPTVGT